MFKRGIGFLSFAHCVNDFLNGVVGSILPLLAYHFGLSYGQTGAISMTANVSSSLIQPAFGYISDKKGSPWVLPFGSIALGIGLWWLGGAPSYAWLFPAVILSGIGSAAFHPDASRAVYFAAGDKRGLAQSVFQIGGNSGMAISALALLYLGHTSLHNTAWFMVPAILSTITMFSLLSWFSERLKTYRVRRKEVVAQEGAPLRLGLSLLVIIVTVRSLMVSCVTVFVPLWVERQYGTAPANVWIYQFVFLLFGAIGTMMGGPLADRFGQRSVIRFTMAVSAPLAVILPFMPHALILPDLALLGLFMLSTFAVTVVYGQELLPGNIAMVSGMLIGFAGGIGGLGAMLVGIIADHIGLSETLRVIFWCMPLAALLTLRLPIDQKHRQALSVGVQ